MFIISKNSLIGVLIGNINFLQVSKITSQELLDRAKRIAYNHKIILIENKNKPYHLLANDKAYLFFNIFI